MHGGDKEKDQAGHMGKCFLAHEIFASERR